MLNNTKNSNNHPLDKLKSVGRNKTIKARIYALILLIFCTMLTLFYLYSQQTSINTLDTSYSNPFNQILEHNDEHIVMPTSNKTNSVNGVFLIVAKNSDLYKLKKTIQQLEDSFNYNKNYPYLFLNNEPFTRLFVRSISKIISSKAEFSLIPKDHWDVPSSINTLKLQQSINNLKGLPHGDSIEYRQVMRYFSGFFYKHPKISKYDYYWKIQPDAEYLCDFTFDPFERLKNLNKQYAFVIAVRDFEPTIHSLGKTVKEYLRLPNRINNLALNNSALFITENNNNDKLDLDTYNYCHFWSNFEIGKLSFFQNVKYQTYFDYLDKSGNFFYERWGDGPVHTIALSLFLNKNQIWFADEIGYSYTGIEHCPSVSNNKNKCGCLRSASVDYTKWSCLANYEKLYAKN